MTHQEEVLNLTDDISTHILTKRMTEIRDSTTRPGEHFNSHPHEEDDNYRKEYGAPAGHFNSHPHEEDDRPA